MDNLFRKSGVIPKTVLCITDRLIENLLMISLVSSIGSSLSWSFWPLMARAAEKFRSLGVIIVVFPSIVDCLRSIKFKKLRNLHS